MIKLGMQNRRNSIKHSSSDILKGVSQHRLPSKINSSSCLRKNSSSFNIHIAERCDQKGKNQQQTKKYNPVKTKLAFQKLSFALRKKSAKTPEKQRYTQRMNYFSPLLYSKASTPATSDKTPDPVNIKNSVLLPSYEINSSKARNKTDHLGYDPGVDQLISNFSLNYQQRMLTEPSRQAKLAESAQIMNRFSFGPIIEQKTNSRGQDYNIKNSVWNHRQKQDLSDQLRKDSSHSFYCRDNPSSSSYSSFSHSTGKYGNKQKLNTQVPFISKHKRKNSFKLRLVPCEYESKSPEDRYRMQESNYSANRGKKLVAQSINQKNQRKQIDSIISNLRNQLEFYERKAFTLVDDGYSTRYKSYRR